MTEATLRIKVDSSEVKTADKSLADLSRTSKTADGQTKQLTQTTEKLSGAAKAAATAFAALGVSLSVREIIQANDAWVSATNQLRLVTTGTENLAATQRSLLSVANETRSSFESTANLYARLARATTDMGLSQTDLLGITETINQSFAVSGATASEAAAAITQLSQGLAAGALRGDEFNSVAEQAPGIMRAIADSLNLTVGELRAFAAEGGITAEIVVNALQQASASIESDFSKATATLGQSIQIAKNNFVAFAGQSEAVSDGVSSLGGIIVMASEGFDELGDATDYAYRMAVDFAAVMGESVSPVLQDIEFFVLALRDGFAEFGGTVVSTGSAVQTGIAQLDEIVNAFFDNFSTGAVSAAELFSLAFGTAAPNAVAVVQTGTVAIADLFERMKVRITKAGEEEAAALAALDAIRARSVSEIMSARDEELVQLYELIKGQAEARKSVSELVEGQEELTVAVDDTASSTRNARRETKDNTEEVDKARKKAEQYVQTLEQQLNATQMTSRAAAIYEAVMKASAESTGLAKAEADKFIVSAATLAAKLYDVEEAQRAAEQSAKDLQKANDEAAKVAADAWGRTHESLSDIFVDVFDEGGSAFEKVGDMAVATAKRIAAEWLALKAMNLFGIETPSGAGGGAASAITSILGQIGGRSAGNAVVSEIVKGGVGGLAGTVGATGTTTGLSSSIAGAIGAIPGWGWAALGAAAIGAFLNNDDGKVRSNAGMLVGPTPGAKSEYLFSVDPFLSGFAPTGVARREDQADAIKVIDQFREVSDVATLAITELGGRVDMSRATLSGLNQDAAPGSSGTFFGRGMGGADLNSQLNMFMGQFLNHVEGLDAALMSSVQSAGSAEEAVRLLTEAADQLAENNAAIALHRDLLQKFGTDEQKLASAMEEITAEFDRFGAKVPETIDEFHEMVKAIDPLTDSGKKAIEALKGLSGAISTVEKLAGGGATAEAAKTKASTSSVSSFSLFSGNLASNLLQGNSEQDRAGELARRAALENVTRAADAIKSTAWVVMGPSTEVLHGSHASGLDFVPFDGYRAELHRGERVQTASEARNMESLVPVMAQLLQVMNSIARDSADSKVYNRRSYEILDRWQGEGFPVTA